MAKVDLMSHWSCRTGTRVWRAAPVCALIAVLGGIAQGAEANATSRSLTVRAFELAHNLDQDQALAVALEAIAADPEDPAAYRSVAAIVWLKILFRRGVVTFDDYLGEVTGPTVPMSAPPPDLAASFRTHIDRAVVWRRRK